MEVTEHLQVSASEFFELLEDSVKADIARWSNKDTKAIVLKKHLRYKKQMANWRGAMGQTTVEIVDLVAPTLYATKVSSATGSYVVRYEIREDESGCTVFYTEDYQGNSQRQSMNFALMQFFFRRAAKKRISKMLRDIERVICQKRSADS